MLSVSCVFDCCVVWISDWGFSCLCKNLFFVFCFISRGILCVLFVNSNEVL